MLLLMSDNSCKDAVHDDGFVGNPSIVGGPVIDAIDGSGRRRSKFEFPASSFGGGTEKSTFGRLSDATLF